MERRALIVIYIFSVIYCYIATRSMVDRSMNEFFRRHPSLPMVKTSFREGIKLSLELLAISAIPVQNIFFGLFFDNASDEFIKEVVNGVEISHQKESREFEKSTEELIGSDRQRSAVADD